jgi:hypothetical protein
MYFSSQTDSGAHPTEGSFPRGKVVEAWSWPLISNLCQGKEYADLYIHSPRRLHVVVLNQLSTGTLTDENILRLRVEQWPVTMFQFSKLQHIFLEPSF